MILINMLHRENVIKGLEHCFHGQECCGDTECPYFIEHLSDCCCLEDCQENLKADAIALLKEQETVEPHYNARTNWYECGACHYSMTSGMHCRGELIPAYKVGFCAKCGKAVKWE